MSNCPARELAPDNYWDDFRRGPRGPGLVFFVSSLVSCIALVALKFGYTLLTIPAPFFCEMNPSLDAHRFANHPARVVVRRLDRRALRRIGRKRLQDSVPRYPHVFDVAVPDP